MRVEQFKNRFGRGVCNQFIIRDTNRDIFQSYNSIVAIKGIGGDVLLDKNTWDYSKTTGTYRNIFLGEDKRATEKKIKSGVYKLVALNGEGF